MILWEGGVMHLPTLWVYHPAAEGAAQGHYSLMEVVRGVVHDRYQPG